MAKDKNKNRTDDMHDETLRSVKRKIQQESFEAIRSGRLKQTDLFLVRPELARKAKIIEYKK